MTNRRILIFQTLMVRTPDEGWRLREQVRLMDKYTLLTIHIIFAFRICVTGMPMGYDYVVKNGTLDFVEGNC